MRLYRPPVIGPRAAGVSLLILGVTAFVLLGLFSPHPAEAQSSPSLALASVRCDQLVARAARQATTSRDESRSACDPADDAKQGAAGSMVVQEISDAPSGKMFLSLALVTLGGAMLIEGRLRTGRNRVLPVPMRRQRM